MDKITRILLLYSRLIHGEKINKISFCFETESLPRSFDRDVEDIRLFLSDTFSTNELLYDRSENLYYLSGLNYCVLEELEYGFIEKVLIGTKILRNDEMTTLLQHVASNTDKPHKIMRRLQRSIKEYHEPHDKKPILKLFGDLMWAIENKYVIRLSYIDSEMRETKADLIPCELRCTNSNMSFIAFYEEEFEHIPQTFLLNDIVSFEIIRHQNDKEVQFVNNHLKAFSFL